tara:strand:+ start:1879 stop:2436 length:558 start_codon:yes stop_codon:yes gene_type:complete
LKIFSKLPIIVFLGLANVPGALANIYRVDFTYGSAVEGQNATLSGFMVVNTSLGSYASESQSDLGFVDLPNWITDVSLTFQESGQAAQTTSGTGNFDKLVWNLKPGSIGSFDLNADFDTQFDGFGFRGSNNDYAISTTSKEQQHLDSNAEFPLQSTATTPGGLPLLGLGALAFYYKKFKNKSFKL